MDCEKIGEAEIAEKYVAGQLDDMQQAEFEMHFVDCQTCFKQVQLLQDMQAALARRPRTNARLWTVLAIAASLLVAAGVMWLRLRPDSQREGGRSVTASGTSSPARPALDLTALAMVSPPRYLQPRWRAPNQTGFDLAMQRYTRGDYAGAEPRLVAALASDPGNSAAAFFLGICYLMEGRNDEAVAQLKSATAFEDAPELEEAHFYLAKALLRRHDIAGAMAELRRAIGLHGPHQMEERIMLENLTREAPPAK